MMPTAHNAPAYKFNTSATFLDPISFQVWAFSSIFGHIFTMQVQKLLFAISCIGLIFTKFELSQTIISIPNL